MIMFGRRNAITCCFLAAAVGLVLLADGEAKPAPNPQALADALKVLQELDRYYSQVARPRFGKRTELRQATLYGTGSDTGSDEQPISSNEWFQYSRRR